MSAQTHFDTGNRTACGRNRAGTVFLTTGGFRESTRTVPAARMRKDWKAVTCRQCATARPRVNSWTERERIRKEMIHAWRLIHEALDIADGRFEHVTAIVMAEDEAPAQVRARAVMVLERANGGKGSKVRDTIAIRKLLATGAALAARTICRATGIPQLEVARLLEAAQLPHYGDGPTRYYDRDAYWKAGRA